MNNNTIKRLLTAGEKHKPLTLDQFYKSFEPWEINGAYQLFVKTRRGKLYVSAMAGVAFRSQPIGTTGAFSENMIPYLTGEKEMPSIETYTHFEISFFPVYDLKLKPFLTMSNVYYPEFANKKQLIKSGVNRFVTPYRRAEIYGNIPAETVLDIINKC